MKQTWTIVIAALFSLLARGAEPGINFLYNGGFEKETNPGLADGWGPFYWDWGFRGETSFYRDLGTLMHLDREEAFEGKKSMRLVLPPSLRQLNIQHPYVSAMVPGKEAVFSACLKTVKGRRAQVRFMMRFVHAPGSPAKTFTVDDQWRRYEMTFKVPKGCIQPWIQLIDGYAVWIDAVKLEHGSRASAFVQFTENRRKNETAAGRRAVPRYRIPVLDKAPALTGTMSDPGWKQALEIKDFYQVKTGAPVTRNRTLVRMFIHGTTLYVAAECDGPNSKPLIRERDGMVWSDDCFELFLDPGNPAVHDDLKTYGSYYHLVFNAAGAVYDSYTGGETRPFNGRIETRTSRTDDRWVCEIAIDLASLNINPVKSGWRFLLGREDHTSNQYSANVPLPQKFHDYDRFAEAEVPSAPVEKLNSIQVRPPELDGSALTLRLKCREKLSAKYELAVSRNRKELLHRTGRLELGKNELTVGFSLPQVEDGQTTVELTVRGDSGERLVRSWTIDSDPGIYFRRSYYTSEKEAELIWNGELPNPDAGADFNGKRVAWRKADGKLIFDLSGVPDGVYPVRIGGHSVMFAKFPAKSNEVKIDRLNNILLVNGKPFIFYGPFLNFGFLQRFALETWVVKELKNRGFNGLVLSISEGYIPGSWGEKNRCLDADGYKKILDVCAAHGLKVIAACFYDHSRSRDYVSVNNPRSLVPKLKDHPALLAWYFCDEPVAAHYRKIWEDYNYTRKADPYHPYLVNVTDQGLATGVVRDKKTGRNPFDIYSLTYYPVGHVSAPNAQLKDTTGLFEKMRAAARKERGVLYHAAQAYGYGTDLWYREPTPAEVSFLVYMPLLYGNTGWQWFGGPAKCPATQRAIESYIPEMRFMAELIGNGGTVNRGEVFASLCGNVLGTLRRYRGRYYLLTVNQTDRELKTRFNLAARLPGKPKTAEVLFERRSHDLLSEDRYGPFQRHVYVFELK